MHRHYESLGSTNDAARAWASDASTPAPHGAVVSADAQTDGHGRRGRDWASPRGKGVYLSLVWRPEMEVAHLGRLTILVALAAAQAVEKISGTRAQTKWPNDVLLEGRKLGGVLCEAQLDHSPNEGTRPNFVIAGVGLNLNFAREDLPERPIFPATSLLIETGREYSTKDAREVLIAKLQSEYARYANGDWNAQRGEFIARCMLLGQPIRVQGEGTEYSGVAVGIDNDGFLVVQNGDGLRAIAAGDVSLVPV
jgi:BirA family biotin operon repressor/biotin-[acetyl-CoA-carboxylase] ligase